MFDVVTAKSMKESVLSRAYTALARHGSVMYTPNEFGTSLG